MDDQEKNELMQVVDQQKNFIINYLKHLNLKIKSEVSLLFSDGEVDEVSINQQTFTNLWELQYEPSLVKAEFIIESLNESNLDLHRLMEFLLIQLLSTEQHEPPYDLPNQSTTLEDNYNCFQSIQISKQKNGLKIILTSGIGYFN